MKNSDLIRCDAIAPKIIYREAAAEPILVPPSRMSPSRAERREWHAVLAVTEARSAPRSLTDGLTDGRKR